MSSEFDRFVEIVAALRGPNGCPWDKKQTHESLKPYFVEETYEALHAIDEGDDEELAGELGDVLLQIGLHAQIGSEDGTFSIEDVCRKISDKLVRRHPHVFSGVEVSGVEDVLTNWQEIKKAERGGQAQESVLDGVVPSLPSLMLAMEVSKKAARAGFEWPGMADVFVKLQEETSELEEAIHGGAPEEIESEIGDLLFTIVNISRWADVDPEQALRSMVRRFSARFRAMEDRAKAAGVALEDQTAEDWDEAWNLAKKEQT